MCVKPEPYTLNAIAGVTCHSTSRPVMAKQKFGFLILDEVRSKGQPYILNPSTLYPEPYRPKLTSGVNFPKVNS